MSDVTLVELRPRRLAAVRRQVLVGQVGQAFRTALDQVWAFLRRHPGLREDGHNVFLYEPGADGLLTVDFGVEVVRPFDGEGEVRCVTTPSGPAVECVHRGSYDRLGETHAALGRWCDEHGRPAGSHSLEIYGDPAGDPAAVETTVQYTLADGGR